MKCPYCGNSTHVTRTSKSVNGRRIVRHRRCDADSSHRFETEESVPVPALTAVGVKRSGDGKVGRDPFDRERLFNDISSAVLGKRGGDDERIERVVTRTVFLLERNMTKFLEPLNAEEAIQYPHLKGSISDTLIADIVEGEMQRSSMRMQRLLYALSIRGRQDRQGRIGWENASEVLAWIGTVYPRLQPMLPKESTSASMIPPTIWNFRENIDYPKFVVKKDPRLSNRKFQYDQFVKSINLAMLGRKNPVDRGLDIANRVLALLQGQETVHTSQLGSGVLDALRGVDDIAYLRWATILKRIPSVTAFAEEARGLVIHPSPKLLVLRTK